MPPAIASVIEQDFYHQDNLAALVADLHNVLAENGVSRSKVGYLFQRVFEVAAVTEQTIADQRSRIDYLESLSITDELTGLYNRRGFVQVLEKTLATARRHNEVGMLAYLDLDGFKQVNDTYGHEAGDLVLRHVATTLIRNTRNTDYIARLGGDEFVILYCRAEQMPTRARALQQQEMLNSTIVNYNGIEIPIQTSMGLEIYGPFSEAEELLRHADQSMYRQKQSRKEHT